MRIEDKEKPAYLLGYAYGGGWSKVERDQKPWAGCEVGHQNFTLTSSHRHEPSKQIRLMMRRYERAGLFRDDGASPYAIIRYILMTDIFIT
jgi:hypothetical protein